MQTMSEYPLWSVETSQIAVIQSCITQLGYKHYLEIGVKDGTTFFSLHVENRTAVEPEITPLFAMNKLVFEEMTRLTHRGFPWTKVFNNTSDAFFELNKEMKETYDVIFIDGFHEREQAVRDIKNSLAILKKGGTIFVHDTNPQSKEEANPLTPVIAQWTGDVWRGIIDIRCEIANLNVFTIPVTYGLTVLQKTEKLVELLDPKYKEYTYEQFDKERDYILNIRR